MVIQMKLGSTKEQYDHVTNALRERGFEIKDVSSSQVIVFGIIGDTATLEENDMYKYEGVFKVTRIQTPFKKASRQFKQADTVIDLGDGVLLGGNHFQMIAGPCSVESEDQLRESAIAVKQGGGTILRGGAFKPRTSPYAFQGMGEEGLILCVKLLMKLDLKSSVKFLHQI
jgi:3-deoxy-7-phosphoheptulonate synthase